MSSHNKTPIRNFKLSSTDESITQFSDFKNQWLVLYFYPRDSTSSCIQQAKDFCELYPKLKQRGIQLLGVSRDSMTSHLNFSEKYAIPYPLVSDTKEELCKYFDVIKEKNMYGNKHTGIERSTFIINPEQVVVAEYRKVKVPGHAKEIYETCLEYLQLNEMSIP